MKNRIEKTDAEWKQVLTREQYEVTRRKGTERAFAGKYHDCHEDGVYHCVCCGAALFASRKKFDSGSGWPSFTAPVATASVKQESDTSHFMARTEVLCSQCDAHLGHVFDDGPGPEGKRFCINSVALSLEKK